MKVIAVTGGIGMGKSTAADFLSIRGLPVADTDRIARQLVEPGQPALEEIRQCFGPSVFESDLRLNRVALATLIFANPSARAQLEQILHPRIRRVWESMVADWRSQRILVGAVIIPLLFETGAQVHFDATICLACSASTQLERLRARGWSDLHIAQRIAAQWDIGKKIALSEFVVWTESPPAIQSAQLDIVLESIRQS